MLIISLLNMAPTVFIISWYYAAIESVFTTKQRQNTTIQHLDEQKTVYRKHWLNTTTIPQYFLFYTLASRLLGYYCCYYYRLQVVSLKPQTQNVKLVRHILMPLLLYSTRYIPPCAYKCCTKN